VENVMLHVRRRADLNEGLCARCGLWKLLSWFEPAEGDLLSEVCETCRLERARKV
jgi:hypothetical protein